MWINGAACDIYYSSLSLFYFFCLWNVWNLALHWNLSKRAQCLIQSLWMCICNANLNVELSLLWQSSAFIVDNTLNLLLLIFFFNWKQKLSDTFLITMQAIASSIMHSWYNIIRLMLWNKWSICAAKRTESCTFSYQHHRHHHQCTMAILTNVKSKQNNEKNTFAVEWVRECMSKWDVVRLRIDNRYSVGIHKFFGYILHANDVRVWEWTSVSHVNGI